MIIIRKETDELIVSRAAYNDIFKDLGYEIVSNNSVKAEADKKASAKTEEIKAETVSSEELKQVGEEIKADYGFNKKPVKAKRK